MKTATNLLNAAKEILHLHLCEQEGIGSGQPTKEQWLKAVDELEGAISAYEVTPQFSDGEKALTDEEAFGIDWQNEMIRKIVSLKIGRNDIGKAGKIVDLFLPFVASRLPAKQMTLDYDKIRDSIKVNVLDKFSRIEFYDDKEDTLRNKMVDKIIEVIKTFI